MKVIHSDSTLTPAAGEQTSRTALLSLVPLAASVGTFFMAMATLGKVKWPEYLEWKGTRALSHLASHETVLQQGYLLYLLSALLILPVVFALGNLVPKKFAFASLTLGSLAIAFKALGIGRWLFAMPYLIKSHSIAGGDATARKSLEVSYDLLNLYAGGVGEQFGVALFTALWTLALSLGVLQLSSRLKWATGALGLLIVAMWAGEISLFISGGSVGAIRAIGSILGWVFLILWITTAVRSHGKKLYPPPPEASGIGAEWSCTTKNRSTASPNNSISGTESTPESL
jgi:hypothetical protein